MADTGVSFSSSSGSSKMAQLQRGSACQRFITRGKKNSGRGSGNPLFQELEHLLCLELQSGTRLGHSGLSLLKLSEIWIERRPL